MSVAFISFPRSGSNFIGTNYGRLLDSDVYHSHSLSDVSKYDYIFSIIRNPVDSIASMAALSLDTDVSIEDNCKMLEIYYSTFYYKIVNNNKINLFKFEDIADNFVLVIKRVADITGLEYNGKVNLIYPEPTEDFLSTSKNKDHYDLVVDIVRSMDLSKCEELYRQALERCIQI